MEAEKERELTFYAVDTDPDQFQYFLTDDWERYYFDGRPYRDEWRPPEVFSYKPRLPEPDFWTFGLGGCGTAWAIRPEAFEHAPVLEPMLGYSGELLALPYNGRSFALFNITECIDALDKERTVWDYYDDGTIRDIEAPVFRLDRLGANLFKVPEDSSMRIYFWEDSQDWQSQFRAIVEREDLTGLEFKYLYSAEWHE
jgi:hypothetical protein